MRFTSSFSVFRFDPGEQDLAKPRWLAKEGKVAEAEDEYRKVLGRNPDSYSGWLELFELMRRDGRHQAALELADAAFRHYGEDAAMPFALRGAALAELGRFAEAVKALQEAIARDDGLALAWHEYGYASWKAGHHGQALLALDRAFALEPHTDTLMLRGRVFRDAGRFDAAEVAFQGALQSAEHDQPRREAEREIAATRRAASLGARRPRDFTGRQSWFARAGGVLLCETEDRPGYPGDSLGGAVAELVGLVRTIGWRPAAVGAARPVDTPLAEAIAAALGAQCLGASALDPQDSPLVVTVVNDGRDEWRKAQERLARWKCGWLFALVETETAPEPADIVGVGVSGPPENLLVQLMEVLPGVAAAGTEPPPEVLALARNGLASWSTRALGAPPF